MAPRVREGTVLNSVFLLGVSVLSTTASSLQLSGFGINCQLMLSCPLPWRRSSFEWQAARQLRRQFRDICPVFICTSARFYQLQGLGCYRLSHTCKHFMHPCHARHYSTLRICALLEEREREKEWEREREREFSCRVLFVIHQAILLLSRSIILRVDTVPVLVSTAATCGKQSLRRRQQRCHSVNIIPRLHDEARCKRGIKVVLLFQAMTLFKDFCLS